MDRSNLPQPTADAAAHSARLAALIRDEIRGSGGWIGFDRYMHLVLYAPGLGYYAAGAHKLGDAASGGDFVTAPEISPLFGHTLAKQIAELFEHVAPQILEFGAGSGALARDLLAAMKVERYFIVEVSPELRERQRSLLAGRQVTWLDAPPVDFDGGIIANEVLDVMPVQLFVKRGGNVHERGVALDGDRFVFSERRARQPLAQAVGEIEAHCGVLPDGYASEIGTVARAWVASLGIWLRRGAALLIDYGFPRREYYHPQRLMGTIMCHRGHRAHADPFWLPGLNDLTAHVDFSALADSTSAAGLEVLGYCTQARFLLNCGMLDLVRDEHTAQRSAHAQRLLSEAEMGELFKVLAVGRGIDVPLLGFAEGDRRHTL